MRPLNLYLDEAGPEAARQAVIDYGQAIKDLACTNIFTGDLLLKNFGVTRHQRVIFYDYDEVSLVTECRFRDIPEAADDADEMRAGAWYFVGGNDIFPEEFMRFLRLDDDLKGVFMRHHADLLTARYWRGIQDQRRRGEVSLVAPYNSTKGQIIRA